jgi:hypothetical protein
LLVAVVNDGLAARPVIMVLFDYSSELRQPPRGVSSTSPSPVYNLEVESFESGSGRHDVLICLTDR